MKLFFTNGPVFVVAAALLPVIVSGCSNQPAPTDRCCLVSDPMYEINHQSVNLGARGPDGMTMLVASVSGDLNRDGHADLAVILRQASVGSGVFYYLNVFLNNATPSGELIGEVFLGDRIGFDFLDIYGDGSRSLLTGVAIHPDDFGKLVVAYFDYATEQSYAEQPSIYLTQHWGVVQRALVRIEDN